MLSTSSVHCWKTCLSDLLKVPTEQAHAKLTGDPMLRLKILNGISQDKLKMNLVPKIGEKIELNEIISMEAEYKKMFDLVQIEEDKAREKLVKSMQEQFVYNESRRPKLTDAEIQQTEKEVSEKLALIAQKEYNNQNWFLRRLFRKREAIDAKTNMEDALAKQHQAEEALQQQTKLAQEAQKEVEQQSKVAASS